MRISDWSSDVCSSDLAGHKAMWHDDFGGLPSEKFLSNLDPYLGELRQRLYQDTYTSDQFAGILAPYWARRWGLPEGVKVGVGAIDAHMGAIGAGIDRKSTRLNSSH